VTHKLSKLPLFIWFFIFLSMGSAAHGETPASKEHAIKAAFIYNFAKFVEWPAESFEKSGDFVVCVFGEDSIVPTLKKLNGKQVQGKKVTVKHTKSSEDIGNCHIVYVSRQEEKNFSHVMTALKGRRILTVGDMEGFAQRGGMINFAMKKRKVRFEINVDAAKQAGLKISSKLLRLADIVGGNNS